MSNFPTELLLKIPVLDYQHEKLWNIFLELIDLIQRKEHDASVDKLNLFLGYSQVHFLTEEHMMIKSNYPEYTHHKDAHQFFEDQLLDLYKIINNAETASVVNILVKIKEWLMLHIQQTDRLFVEYWYSKNHLDT